MSISFQLAWWVTSRNVLRGVHSKRGEERLPFDFAAFAAYFRRNGGTFAVRSMIARSRVSSPTRPSLIESVQHSDARCRLSSGQQGAYAVSECGWQIHFIGNEIGARDFQR